MTGARRIIFLDIDGVLISTRWLARRGRAGDPQDYDPEAVARLNAIIERGRADVVLSSSRRTLGVDAIRSALERAGFRGRILGRTPLPDEHQLDLFRRLRGADEPAGRRWPRGYEIQQWLDSHAPVGGVVIVDDSLSIELLEPWQVRTTMQEGLLDEHVERALARLERPAPPPSDAGLRDEPLSRLVLRKLAAPAMDRPLRIPERAPNPGSGVRDMARWRSYFAAFDRWRRWIELGREADEAGDYVEANACFAAASWLEPEAADPLIERVVRRRPSSIPPRIRAQPDPEFSTQPPRRRARAAASLAEHGLVELPTLLRWSSDPSPEVRAVIYRGLGWMAHPAVVQALHEGLRDSHSSARLEAIRALGWCGDPTAVEGLRELADGPLDDGLCRAARVAIDRVRGYWALHGEWWALAESPARAVWAARRLMDIGCPELARDVLRLFAQPRTNHRSYALLEQLGDSLELELELEELLVFDGGANHSSGAEAGDFEARRALRFAGHGSMDQRRGRPALGLMGG